LKINFSRLVRFYLGSIIPAAIVLFLLILAAYIPAVREAAVKDDSTPGVGLFFIFCVVASCLGGVIGAIPVALVLERVFGDTTRTPQQEFYERFLERRNH
jgi:hypothetical protein